MKEKSTLVIIILILLASTTTANLMVPALGAGTEIKVTNPFTGNTNFIYYTNTTAVGTRFNATVHVYDAVDLFAYQVFLQVDDSLLNITNAWLPTWDLLWIFQGMTTIRPSPAFYDGDSDGYIESVKLGDTLLMGTLPTGDGLLAVIEFEIIYAPSEGTVSADLDIDNVDTYLLDLDLNETSTLKTSGYYEYNGPPVPPVPVASITLDPSRIVDTGLVPCNNFDVNVTIVNASDLYSYQFKLGYDPAIVTVVSAVLGDLFPPTVVPTVIIENTIGYVSFSASLSPPDPPVSGDGTLATIVLHVEGLGGTDLDLYDVALYDESSDPLPFATEDGFFSNVLLAKIYIDPPELIDPGLVPPAIFTVDVVLDDVENLYKYEFKLDYNTNMLTCIGILIHPILNETHFTTEMLVDDPHGLVSVRVTYEPPAVPITTYSPQSIVTLTFMIDNMGSSVLDLYDTSLTDPSTDPIPHEATDGYVMTLIRDVAVINVTVSNDWVFETWPLDVTVYVKNEGNVTETFEVKAYYDSSLIGTQMVIDLSPGDEQTLVLTWDTSGVTPGIYVISAEAAPVPDEYDLTDNTYVDGWVKIEELIRDVAITGVSAYPSIIYAGWLVNVSVTCRNEGNLTETFDVIVYYDINTMVTFTATDLAPNDEMNFLYVWDTTGLPDCSNFTISAEATAVPSELDLADNYMVDGWVKIKILGDINGDGKVDILDVATVAAAFGSFPGHPRWNPVADLNLDDKVDIRDVAMVASNFGRVC